MKNINQIKIKAFTFIEITIAMLLVAIIAAIAYYVLQTFVHASSNQQVRKREKYSLELLLHRLHIDWTQAEFINYQDQTLILRDTTGVIKYVFSDSLVLRNQYEIQQDSFHFVTQHIHTETMKNKDDSTPLIHKISAQFQYKEFIFPLVLVKRYAATQLLGNANQRSHDTD